LSGCATTAVQPQADQIPAATSPSPGTFGNLEEIHPAVQSSLGAESADWYRDAVFYHIWVNAFNDSDGDGVGDIRGIIQKLDYLDDLGITAIWLSPFFESASESINLHMYDTTDHYRVDPRFGTNADVDELLVQAHQRGIRVIFDFVPNHVSDKHPWFQESAAGDSEKADWFVWRDGSQAGSGPWGQDVMHGHENGRFYYGVFWSGMPDINYRNQDAKDAMTNVAIYWLNRGFDGMRVDAVRYLYEDTNLVRQGRHDECGHLLVEPWI
jgi:alpha-glucosidase